MGCGRSPALRAAVSWLLPVRDGARWLGDALRSALAECGPDDEVIVVDDGSRDQPERVVPTDPRLRLLVQAPLGIVAALELGRAACSAPFIARLDADDVALPGRIETQLAAFEADPGLVAVGGQARIQRDDGPVPEGMLTYVAWVNGLSALEPQLLVESPLFHPAVTFRASAVAAVGGYRPGDLPEDYDLWLRLPGRGLPRGENAMAGGAPGAVRATVANRGVGRGKGSSPLASLDTRGWARFMHGSRSISGRRASGPAHSSP